MPLWNYRAVHFLTLEAPLWDTGRVPGGVSKHRRRWSFSRGRRRYQDPAELEKAVQRSARIRGDLGRNLFGLFAVAARLGVYLVMLAGVLAVVGYGVREVYVMLTPREISVCVATDAAFRATREDWRERVDRWFAYTNEAFRPTAVTWTVRHAGEAYPPETMGNARQRQWVMEELATCRADVLIGFTAPTAGDAASSIAAFGHSGLLAISDGDSDLIASGVLQRALASLFGRVATAADERSTAAGLLDASTVQLVRKLRDYDFSHGAAALAGRWERRAADAIAGSLEGRAANPELEAHRALARAFGAGHMYREAAEQWRRAVEADPNDVNLRVELALALKGDSAIDAAIEEAKKATAVDPKNAAPHALLGAFYRDRGRLFDAIDEFRTATKLDPSQALYFASLGDVLRQQSGRGLEAEEALSKAIELDPENAKARRELSVVARAKETAAEDIESAEAALRANPNSEKLRFDLAYAQARAGQVDQALASFGKALGVSPSNGPAHIAMARLYFNRGQYQEAQDQLRLAESNGARAPQDLGVAVRNKLRK